jgi:hypothetical protein
MSQKKPSDTKRTRNGPGAVVHACHPTYVGSTDRKVTVAQSETPSQKYPTQKGLETRSSGGVPAYQVKSLSSSPSTAKKKKKERKEH